MTSRITIAVEEGASHGVRGTLTSTTTGQEYAGETIDAGDEHTFVLEDEQQLTITRGAATPEADEAEADSTAKKK